MKPQERSINHLQKTCILALFQNLNLNFLTTYDALKCCLRRPLTRFRTTIDFSLFTSSSTVTFKRSFQFFIYSHVRMCVCVCVCEWEWEWVILSGMCSQNWPLNLTHLTLIHTRQDRPLLFQSSFFPSLPQPAPFFLFYPHLQISPATSPLLSSDPLFGLSCGLGFCFMHSECSAEWKQTRLSDSFTLQSSKQDTHTHTHTHVGFYGLRGLSIGVMVFILYKLYVLLPYT